MRTSHNFIIFLTLLLQPFISGVSVEPVRIALGLLLVRLGRNPEATLSLQRATELAPANARFAYVHAVALHSAGQVERALHRLRTASERHPSDRDLLQALAAMSRDAGHTQQAGEALRRLEALTEGATGSR